MSNRARVLVIEDEPAIRRLVRASLEPEGYQVTEAESGEDGLEKLRDRAVDLLVLDLALPGMSGWQVLEEMGKRGLRSELRVVLLTARSAEGDILRGWRMGVDHYCMKPFEPKDFLEIVRFVLSASDHELERQREEELSKTQLLHMVDSVFDVRN